MAARVRPPLTFLTLSVLLYILVIYALSAIRLNQVPLIYRTANYYAIPGGISWEQFREFDPDKKYDVVVLGSSHAYRGYDPAVFLARGHEAFNLGSSSQTPLNSYWLINGMLDSSNTGLVVLDVYDTALVISGLECTMELTQNIVDHKAAMGMAWSQRDLRALNMIAVRFATDRSAPYSTDTMHSGRGFAPHLDSIKTAPPPSTGQPAMLLGRQKYFIGQIIDLCRQRGIKLVFASHYARRNLQGPFHVPLVHFMDSLQRATGIPFLDYTDAAGIDQENWFADANHLNLTGARIFTAQLIDSLESMGLLTQGNERHAQAGRWLPHP